MPSKLTKDERRRLTSEFLRRRRIIVGYRELGWSLADISDMVGISKEQVRYIYEQTFRRTLSQVRTDERPRFRWHIYSRLVSSAGKLRKDRWEQYVRSKT